MIIIGKNGVIINTGTARPLWSRYWRQYYVRGSVWDPVRREWVAGTRIFKVGPKIKETTNPKETGDA